MVGQVCHSVSDESAVGHARRVAGDLAREMGLDETVAGKIGIVVTELGRNLVRHAGGGELILGPHPGSPARFDVYSIDKGPGMSDTEACLRDGFSTGGTQGAGLGAVKRLSQEFFLHSRPNAGTIVVARLGPVGVEPSPRLETGVISIPMPGERDDGDSWAEHHTTEQSTFMVVDGLGHGVLAREAALEAVATFSENPFADPAELVNLAHGALRKTRGAALAVAQLFYNEQQVRYAGVGNIGGIIIGDDGSRSLVSHNGTVGHNMRRVQEFTYPFPTGSLLVMYSDGLASHWSLDRYPGLFASHPSLIAGVLYRDFSRRRDDVTVLTARERMPA